MLERFVYALFLGLSFVGFANSPIDDLANNAYVQLYEQWVALDHNQVERLEVIKKKAEIDLRRGEKLHETKVVTADELEELQTKYQLSVITLQRQQLKIKESEARLSIVKSKVAAGVTDIPICVRPMDIP
ncbi:MAG: hypothetical protein ACKN9V_04190 [Pseudomonadota bacterium]